INEADRKRTQCTGLDPLRAPGITSDWNGIRVRTASSLRLTAGRILVERTAPIRMPNSSTTGAPAAPTRTVDPRVARAAAPVIFFDGVCGLCDRWVSFVLARDRRNEFLFATLQGETARERLQIAADQPLNSVVLVDERGEHRKSDAVWRILVR